MTTLRTDRFLRLIEPPAFLAALGPKDRMLWRVAIAPVLVVVLIVLVGVVCQPVAQWLGDQISTLVAALGLAGVDNHRIGGCLTDSSLTCAGLTMMQAAVWFVPATVAVLLALALLMGRAPRTWIAAGAFRWRLALLGLVGGALVIAPFDIAAVALAEAPAPGPLTLPEPVAIKVAYILACLAFLPVWAFFEEVLYRGWLLQQFAALTRSLALVLLVDAALFALSHGDLEPGPLVARTVFGLVLAWSVLRLDGIAFAVGAHAANNLLIALFIEPILSGVDMAPHTPPLQSALDVAGSLALLALVEVAARRVSPSAAAEPEPSAPEATLEAHP
jgi:membrane protease YdiL (CAAX protease family)